MLVLSVAMLEKKPPLNEKKRLRRERESEKYYLPSLRAYGLVENGDLGVHLMSSAKIRD